MAARFNIPKDMAQVPKAMREIIEQKAQTMLDKYMEKLVKTMNWMALSILSQRGDDRVLTFTARRKEMTILIRPSDMLLFRELEFGLFDEDGRLLNPPHSVLKETIVMIESGR